MERSGIRDMVRSGTFIPDSGAARLPGLRPEPRNL